MRILYDLYKAMLSSSPNLGMPDSINGPIEVYDYRDITSSPSLELGIDRDLF